METLIINVLLAMMALAVVILARSRNLFAVVVLGGVYSFLMATVLVALDAVDVAMTEAAVGAGISTVLLLGALHLCKSEEAKPIHRPWLPLAVACGTAAVLAYGTLGLPAFSDPQAPIHTHVAPRYLAEALAATGVPNVVTAVLASYRGFDTLGETTVVFTAGAGVIALLRRRKKNGDQHTERAQPASDRHPLPRGEDGNSQSTALRRPSRLAVQSQPWGGGRGEGSMDSRPAETDFSGERQP